MEYQIFPPIGIGRIGNSSEFFIGPEVSGSRGRELTSTGETEIEDFKDGMFQVKKQAVRFHLFERSASTDPFVPAVLPPGASIRWSVQVINKKDGIIRPPSPPLSVPAGGLRPTNDLVRANRIIDSGLVQISGANASGQMLQGTHLGTTVRLGELRTDALGRLLFLGGNGISRSHPVSSVGPNFYNNANWFDDVCDGPVKAEVVFSDGHVEAAGTAWVIAGPPDFAPGADCIVTLYDIIHQVAVDQGWQTAPSATSFTRDIFPLLRRAHSLRWAHGRMVSGTVISEPTWNNVSEDFPRLANVSALEMPLRTAQKGHIRAVQSRLLQYRLTLTQAAHLDRWEAGNFASDWTGMPAVSSSPTAASLTRSTLDGTAGQGFFPGIEGGILLTDPSIYASPFDFRIDHASLSPGDITALMAQPWQADFLKCRGNWWPSQRPDIAPQSDGTFKLWARIGPSEDLPTHQQLVDHVMQFGMVTRKTVGGVEVCIEEGRDMAAGP